MTGTKKFKLGDRVKVVKCACHQCDVQCKYIGLTGTVRIGYGVSQGKIYVNNFNEKEPGHGCSGFIESDLKLIEEDWDQ